jgi:hypothetical protein
MRAGHVKEHHHTLKMPLKTAVSIVQQGIPVKPSRILHAVQHSAQTGKVTNRDYTMPQDGPQTLCISCASAMGSVHGSEAAMMKTS